MGKDQGCYLRIPLKRNSSRHLPQYIHSKNALINSHHKRKILFSKTIKRNYMECHSCGSNKHDIVLERVTNQKWHWLALLASFTFLASFLSSLPPAPFVSFHVIFSFQNDCLMHSVLLWCTSKLVGSTTSFLMYALWMFNMPWDAKGGSYLENFPFYIEALQSWHSEMQTGLGLVFWSSEDLKIRISRNGCG